MTRIAPLALLLVIPAAAARAEDLRVASDFPGGSAEVVEIDQQARKLRIRPANHEGRGWRAWWYFQLSGIEPGETIRLEVGEAPWATPDRAAIRVGEGPWSQTARGRRQGKMIEYELQIDAPSCYLAWGPSFLPADAQALVDAAARHEFATAFELCRTRRGHAVPALVVNEADGERPPHNVWIQARQHAWESGSSWVCRGLVEWLVSDDLRAASLRRTARIEIVPVMDVDNVLLGAGGKNQQPQDHNRDWSDTPHWPSVRAAMERIGRLESQGGLDLFVDLHNPGLNDKQPFYYVPPRDLVSEAGRRNLDRFLGASGVEINGPLALDPRTRETGANYDKNWRNISKNWVLSNTNPEVVSVTLETSWNTPHSTTAGYVAVGRQLGQAIERYFRTR